jgi:hypothetical protein
MPLIASSERMQKQMAILSGNIPGTEPTTIVTNSYLSLTSLPSRIQTFKLAIQNTLTAYPNLPPEPPPGGAAAVSEAATQTGTLSVNFISDLTAMINTEEAAHASALSQLQSYSFASFLSGDHSPAIAAILATCIDVPEELQVEKTLMSATTQQSTKSVSRSMSPFSISAEDDAAPLPAPDTTTAIDPNKYQAFRNLAEEYEAAKLAVAVEFSNCQQWQIDHNYTAVQDAYLADPEDEAKAAAWQDLLLDYKTEVYADYEFARESLREAETNLREAAAKLSA